MAYGKHNYHLYVIRCKQRDELQSHLADCGITTLIHYPVPIHLQKAYSDLHKHRGEFPVAEALADQILSLPIFPELKTEETFYIVDCINTFQ